MLDLVSCVEVNLFVRDWDQDAIRRLLVREVARGRILDIP